MIVHRELRSDNIGDGWSFRSIEVCLNCLFSKFKSKNYNSRIRTKINVESIHFIQKLMNIPIFSEKTEEYSNFKMRLKSLIDVNRMFTNCCIMGALCEAAKWIETKEDTYESLFIGLWRKIWKPNGCIRHLI